MAVTTLDLAGDVTVVPPLWARIVWLYWLIFLVPVAVVFGCRFLSRRAEPAGVARHAFLVLRLHFAACTLVYVAAWWREGPGFCGVEGLAIWVADLLDGMAVILAMALGSATVVVLRFGRQPRLWQPRYAVAACVVLIALQALFQWFFRVAAR